MERWEKEYLEAIGKDGTSNKKKTSRGAKIGLGVFCALFACGFAFLVYLGSTTPKQPVPGVMSGSEVAASNAASSVTSGSTISPQTNSGTGTSATPADPAQTYIDGIGFKTMMATANELTDIQTRVNNEMTATNFSPSAASIQGYKTEIATWLEKMQSLQYHNSYQDVMQCFVNEAATMNGLLDCVAQNAGASTINQYTQALRDLNTQENETLIAALTANNVSYTVGADGTISYTYKQY